MTERETEEDEIKRWQWVLCQVADAAAPLVMHPERRTEFAADDGQPQFVSHITWLAYQGEPKSAGQAMRWAAWAQGVACVFGWLSLEECKRMNIREAWERARSENRATGQAR